jgi:hypothetical protein
MNQQIKQLNNQFNRGILPDDFNFSITMQDPVDMSKLQYNSFYKTFEYAQSKFPQGYESIPNFEKVIESCIPQHTPLEEMNNIIESSKCNKPSQR